jgi:hypothetical protein
MDVDWVISTFPAPMDTKSNSQVANAAISPTNKVFQWPTGLVQEGGRNETMLRYVGHLRKRKHTEEEILALALAMNAQKFDPALHEDEVADICDRYSHQNAALPDVQFSAGEVNGEFLKCSGTFQVPVTPPPRRDYIFAGQVTAGTLNVIGGQGGVSKTMLVMQACVAAAVGDSLGDLKVSPGASLLFLGEEDQAERDRRMGAICDHFKADRLLVSERIKCFGAAGIDIRLTQKVESNAHATELGNEVIKAANAHAQEAGMAVKIIVFDHARLVLGGDPNSAEDVTQLTRVLTNIARVTGAAVLLLAHSPKSVANKTGLEIGASDIAGSSAFVDNARAAYMMWTMRDDEAKTHHISEVDRRNYVRLENVKANYAQTGGGFGLSVNFCQIGMLQFLSLFIFNLRA